MKSTQDVGLCYGKRVPELEQLDIWTVTLLVTGIVGSLRLHISLLLVETVYLENVNCNIFLRFL